MYQSYKDGWIETISGCMFAGKTEELIRRIKVLEFAKKEIMVFILSIKLIRTNLMTQWLTLFYLRKKLILYITKKTDNNT